MSEQEEVGRRSVIQMLTVSGELADLLDESAGEYQFADEKYEIKGQLGAGGMGEVLLVDDRDLRRQVAMKVLLDKIAKDPQQKLNFVAEAQATSQLEHPGIPPVHDIGVMPDGRVYFTMKLVRGETLQAVIADLVEGKPETVQEYTLHKLVSILERVAEALHFAHERGVIHRDLKPENLMLGEYGEVHVMDWGIAKVGSEPVGEDTEELINTANIEAGRMTLDGTVKGTIPYMSPEQAKGVTTELTLRSDIYSLGVILYEMLTLMPAFEFEGFATILKVLENDFVPVREKNLERVVPEPLAELCARAMSADPEARPATAVDFSTELRAWLDGRSEAERRHEQAEMLVVMGRRAADQYEWLKEEVETAREAAEAEAKKYKAWQPVSEKEPLIEARERVELLRMESSLAFAETVKHLEAALLEEERNSGARSALAELWGRRLEEAELRRDRAQAAYALEMIRRFDDGSLTALISGDGRLLLDAEPGSAEVFLSRFEVERGMQVKSEERSLGKTPVDLGHLPMGSYAAVLRAEGYPDVIYPAHITRKREWKGTVRLRTEQELGEGFVHVPGGPFVFAERRETRTVEIDDFAISRFPVTFAEYAEFLLSLSPEEAVEHIPQTPGDGPYMERGPDGLFRVLPILVEGPPRERMEQEYGEGFEMRNPVAGVSYDDALAFCEWKSSETGLPIRLPTEQEREKAARGVDGRSLPWGELQDATLAKCRESRNEPYQPEPVGTFPTAVSVYGMRDAAGGVWNWTDSFFDAAQTNRVIKGGSWSMAIGTCRCAARFQAPPRVRDSNIGFRCAHGFA